MEKKWIEPRIAKIKLDPEQIRLLNCKTGFSDCYVEAGAFVAWPECIDEPAYEPIDAIGS